MMRAVALVAAVLTLAAVWLGPLPGLAARSFTAHMTMHIAVVAIAAPLLALGLTDKRFDPTRRFPSVFSAIPASILELVVVWGWHAPALHHAARGSAVWLTVEQILFLTTGLFLWMSAAGGADRSRTHAATGIVALLLTSMHMTLLGSLLALSPRPLYAHPGEPRAVVLALDDQHRGGAIMLLVGGASYLAGGLWLSARLLDQRRGDVAGTERTMVLRRSS